MVPDLVILNGAVLTMDAENPRAEALSINGNIVVFAGSNDEAKAMCGASTRIIDAKGATVLPGIVESHMHLFAGALDLEQLNLFGVHGFDNLRDSIEHFAKANPGNGIIVANQADYVILSKDEPVTRHHLDRIIPDRPFMMYSPDHHTAWANTEALRQGGILGGKAVRVGNEVVMGLDGLANGELREGEAIDPVRALDKRGERPRLGLTTGGEPDSRPTPEEFEDDIALMKRGLAHCARHGITSIQNMDGNLYTLEVLSEIERRGELTARVKVPFHMKNFMPIEALEKASLMAERYNGDMLSSGMVKVFVDGVLDSWTAVMIDDYADRPGWKGEPLFTSEHFAQVATEADRRGLQIAVHAIGDGAVRIVLDGYEAARKANGARDSRHRIEHIEVLHPSDIPRFAELGVVASMQPPHPPGNHGLPLEPTISRIGQARWSHSYAWQTLRNAGVPLAFATDWPVSEIDPIRSIQSAMTRKRWSNDLPDQSQSLAQSLAAYTCDGAYAQFTEDRIGKIKAGMLADILVLSGNLETCDPALLHNNHPAFTICDGRVTYAG